MLIFKSKRKLLTGLTLVLMAVYSLNNVFLSIILSNVINAATVGSMALFLKFAAIGILGFLIFTVVGILMVNCKTRLLKDLNMSIKKTFIKDIVYHSEITDDYSKHLSFMTNDLKQLETKGLEAEFTMLSLAFTFTFALLTAFFYDFWITLVFLIGSLLPILISMIFQNRISKASNGWVKSNAVYTNRLKDYFTGIETVRTYQVEHQVTSKAVEVAGNMEDSLQVMNVNVEMTNQLVYMGVMVFSLLIPFGFGVVRIIQFGVSLASFIAIVQLSNSLRSPAIQIMQLINGYATTNSIKKKYLQARKRESAAQQSQHELPVFETLSIKNLKVRFDQQVLFENVDLKVGKEDKILVVGPSGSGKSTLLRVIQQALPMTEGVYLYNENEYKNRLTESFSLIRQQPLIFEDTVLYNITLGENYTNDEIMEAVALAQLSDVIAEKGLQYPVGENGKNLSTGELQRIEIARALVRKRPIILADEITSALDGKTAGKIRYGLLRSPYTLIEVAHNISESDLNLYTQIWDVQTF